MEVNRNNDIVIGLGFGDEGKGTITSFLCTQQEVNAVVRFSGGPQTAHNVVTQDGRHHTFAQFGSGTFSGVQTLLSRYMLVNPFNMAAEANQLWSLTDADPFLKTFISSSAYLVTPLHVAVNKIREIKRGASPHGSCGEGIGETRSYGLQHPILAPTIRDLQIPGFLEVKLNQYREWAEKAFGGKLDAPTTDEIMDSYYNLQRDRPIQVVSDRYISNEIAKGYNVFEGSQGVLLDERHGFHPHTTWSDTTPRKAQALLLEAGMGRGNVIGVIRTYHTRHGFGPFPSEDLSTNVEEKYPETHNTFGRWQGGWRAGSLDLTLLDYAVKVVGGIDELAITHLDAKVSEVITSYPTYQKIQPSEGKDLPYQESLTSQLSLAAGTGNRLEVTGESQLVDLIETTVSAPVTIKSYGPHDNLKKSSRK